MIHHTSPVIPQTSPPPALEMLRQVIASRKTEVDAWFTKISERTPPFFYNSVDLRNSGFKLAPVDTNLFPGGFNNLTPSEQLRAVDVTKNFLQTYHPNVRKIIIIAEDHTRNLYYLENIAVLRDILVNAGFEIVLTSFAASTAGEELMLESKSGTALTFIPCIRQGNKLVTVDGFEPELVLINNDLTDGAPELLEGLDQIVTPPTALGWYQRRKTSHFEAYDQLAKDFCRTFGLDPWLISTVFSRCGVVNFKERTGIECVAIQVDKVLHAIREKYAQYGITQEPYVFIKSDQGTYGMGIMTARSGEELFEMGKDIRKKMDTIKGGQRNSQVIIQEGVSTIDQVDGNPAEPMIYLIGGKPVGCIYRLNTRRGNDDNLNSPGMAFSSMALHHKEGEPLCDAIGLISRLAAHAAAWECYVESYSI